MNARTTFINLRGFDIASGQGALERDFGRAWRRIRLKMEDTQQDYIIAAVCDVDQSVVAIGAKLRVDSPVDLMIGRHTECDLRLDAPGVSLRQMLVRLYRDPHLGQGRVRLLDLQSTQCFLDQDGERCQSILSDRHAFARFADASLFIVQCSEELRNIEDARAAWLSLPKSEVVAPNAFRFAPQESVQKSETEPDQGPDQEPDQKNAQAQEKSQRARIDSIISSAVVNLDPRAAVTQITRLDGPSVLDGSAPIDQQSPADLVGHLRFDNEPPVPLYMRGLVNGVLIGRYARCRFVQHDTHTSRVHLCLLLDETGLWAIDMASTNGSYANKRSFRTLPLTNALTRIRLGADGPVMDWQPAR